MLKEKLRLERENFIKTGTQEGRKTATLISTVLGEVDRKIDPTETDEKLIDKTVLKVVQSMVTSNELMLESIDPSASDEKAQRFDEIAAENVYLETFLELYQPSQLSVEQIREIIHEIKEAYTPSMKPLNIGVVMKHFKEGYDGRYDGATVSALAREML